MKKYLVIPGEIVSITDGNTHFVSARQLMELYRVSPRECVVFSDECDGLNQHKYILLEPRPSGDYVEYLRSVEKLIPPIK